jgi:hypothetical protein
MYLHTCSRIQPAFRYVAMVKKKIQNTAQPLAFNIARSNTRSRIGREVADKGQAGHEGDEQPGGVLAALAHALLTDQGCLSSLIRWLRVPSNFCSTHMKMEVHTVCGQV